MKRKGRWVGGLGAALLAAGLYAGSMVASSASSTAATGPYFATYDAPVTDQTTDNLLSGVSALSGSDVWTVGRAGSGVSAEAAVWQAKPAKITGTTWNGLIGQGTQANVLLGVSALSDDDVWTVGYTTDTRNRKIPLAYHCDIPTGGGDPECSQVAVHGPKSTETVLLAVSADRSDDAWAVGYSTTNSIRLPLAFHWTGSKWILMSPAPPEKDTDTVLTGVSVVAGDEAWAVGYRTDKTSDVRKTLTEHWFGGSWIQETSVDVGTANNEFNAVSAVGSDDVWAVGDYMSGGVKKPLVELWGGSKWTTKNPAAVGTGDNVLSAVSAFGATDAWVAGYSTGSEGALRTMSQHYTGSWTVNRTQNLSSNDNVLTGVSEIGSKDVWAVGWYVSDDGIDQTLVQHYNGTTPFTLTAKKAGTGSGSVLSAPAGIDCGATCVADFASGTVVTLTATADTGSTFTGWSGACSGSSTCDVTMSQDHTVTATFNNPSVSPSSSHSTSTSSTTPSGGINTGAGGTAGGGFPVMPVLLIAAMLGGLLVLRTWRRA